MAWQAKSQMVGCAHGPELAVRTLLRSYRYHGTPGQAKDLVPVA